ncbi:MAG: hypothetical protein ACPKPY_11145 [Nitrososphaeraceae archaeon]
MHIINLIHIMIDLIFIDLVIEIVLKDGLSREIEIIKTEAAKQQHPKIIDNVVNSLAAQDVQAETRYNKKRRGRSI